MKNSREREDDALAMESMNAFLELTSRYTVGLTLLE
jgi:hypothetical protein